MRIVRTGGASGVAYCGLIRASLTIGAGRVNHVDDTFHASMELAIVVESANVINWYIDRSGRL